MPYPYTKKDAEEYIISMLSADKTKTFAFAITVDDKVVGSIVVFRCENIHFRTAEMGYYIGEPYWGNGLGTSAVKQVCSYIFGNTDIIRIFAEPFAYNKASCRVLEKAGFQFEGLLRNNAIKNRKVLDMRMYSLIKEIEVREMYKIREAFQSDCDGIGKVYCDSWKTAYQNLLPQTYLDLLTVEDCTPDKVSERDVVLVGYGSVLGICHISEARDRDNKVWGEVVAIYLLPEIWGSGQGSELLRYALGKLKKNGFRNICLWVMKGNIRARKFYEKNGFQISGNEREIEIAECRVSEVEYIYYG